MKPRELYAKSCKDQTCISDRLTANVVNSKYGNPHRQIRSLTILDDLIRNAGPGFQRSFADEMLLERLRIIATDPLTDTDVKTRCQQLFRQWAAQYKNAEGLGGIASLYRQLPQRKRPVNKETSKVLRETEQFDADDEDEPGRTRKASLSVAGPSVPPRRRSSAAHTQSSLASPISPTKPTSGTSSGFFSHKSKDKDKKKAKIFNLEKEKPHMNQVIASASVESTSLMNALMHINRETERVSEHPEVQKRFEVCKQLRRQTFRYCTLVMDEQYLGTLLHANDQLSDVLVLYEQLDRSFDYDSDSEDYEGGGGSTGFGKRKEPLSPVAMTQSQLAAVNLDDGPPMMPPRPTFTSTAPNGQAGKARFQPEPDEAEDDDDEDEDDPFADRNAVSTPRAEKKGMDW